ncbi:MULTISPECIES: hypothetical protein [Kocuria]|uniref:Uncharacterized protein n=1 Tax=Kocuria subflava TaxID=1736139 RepID=A0A846U8J0_9MICC|nr:MULTISPECIES: hypothetical protein [Kocuria]NKE09896.1 hypothetical protein [Kocuria subflava]
MADLDPTAAHDALRRPSALTAEPSLLRQTVASAGDSAQQTLQDVVNGPGNTPADRVAAAVILSGMFQDPSATSRIDADQAVDPTVLELSWAPDLQPAARQVLGDPVIVSLLTWASTASPGEPPVSAARTAATLGIDDDGAIYQKVSQRAVQLADQRGTHRTRKDQLRQFTEALGRADQAARQTRDTESEASDGTGPAASSPEGTPESQPGSSASSSGGEHPDHGSDAQPSSWSHHDDRALENLLGRDPQSTQPPSETPQAPTHSHQPPAQADPNHGQPVGFHDSTGSREPGSQGNPQDEASRGWGMGSDGPKDEPRYGDRFEDQRWSDPAAQEQDQPGPGPRRAYDPRALFDGPMSEAQRADEKNVLRNWGITAAVLVGILILVGLLI